MKSIHICRNHWDQHTEYCLLVEKRTGRNILALVIGAVLAVIGSFIIYFWI